MTNPLVSFITTFYNSGDFVHSAMESMLNQTYKNIEFICVNDGSTDGTLERLKEYQKKDSRIIIVNKENQGAAHYAKAVGQEKAKGDFCFLFDHDDKLSLNAIELAIQEFNAKENLDCVTMSVEYIKPSNDEVISAIKLDTKYNKISQEINNYEVTGTYAFEKTLGEFQISILGLWKTDVFKSVSFHYQENLLNADELIWRQLFLKCHKIGSCNGVYYYYQHPNSTAKTYSIRHIDIIKTDALIRHLAIENGLYEKNKSLLEYMIFRNLIKSIKVLKDKKHLITPHQYKEYKSLIKDNYIALNKGAVLNHNISEKIKLYYRFLFINFFILFYFISIKHKTYVH